MSATLQGLELFVDVYMKLDRENPDGVDKTELISKCQERDLTFKDIKDWMAPFKNDVIVMDEFCAHMGFDISTLKLEEAERDAERQGDLPVVRKEFHIISTTMTIGKQVEITEKFEELYKEAAKKEEEIQIIPQQLKTYMDETHGLSWQVILLEGSYWMHFSHEPFMSLQFAYGPFVCLVWRTPES